MLEAKLDYAFRSVCRSLFRREVGGLSEFRDYLKSAAEPVHVRKSSVSGKDVHFSFGEYPEKGKHISYDEIKELPKYELDVNSIKDVDSLLAATSENFYYCGDKNLGKSVEVEKSDGCMDTGFVLESNEIYDSQYIAYSSQLSDSKYVFGSTYAYTMNTIIGAVHGYQSTRVFQTGFSSVSSDVYASWYVINCNECMFSFNQRNKRHVVGNLELEREKYLALKEKLLGEMAEWLEKRKSFPSMFEVAEGKP